MEKNQSKMDDLGVPPFMEASKRSWNYGFPHGSASPL